MQPADEYSEGTSVQPSPDRKRRNGDPYATHALTDNPLLLPLMAHPEPMQRRSRSFNDDLAWIRIAQRYSIAARSTELNVYRCTRRWQGFKNGFLNLIASFVVAMSQLCNTEAVLGCFVTIVSVTGYWFYGQYLAAHMNWSIVSLAVVFPITQALPCVLRPPPPHVYTRDLPHHAGHRHGLPAAGAGAARPFSGARLHALRVGGGANLADPA